jgi:hypothetical protein
MWLAENWFVVESYDNALSHPRRIQEWSNENPPALPSMPDLGEIEAPRPRITLETAKKVNKLAAMAERGGRLVFHGVDNECPAQAPLSPLKPPLAGAARLSLFSASVQFERPR